MADDAVGTTWERRGMRGSPALRFFSFSQLIGKGTAEGVEPFPRISERSGVVVTDTV